MSGDESNLQYYPESSGTQGNLSCCSHTGREWEREYKSLSRSEVGMEGFEVKIVRFAATNDLCLSDQVKIKSLTN